MTKLSAEVRGLDAKDTSAGYARLPHVRDLTHVCARTDSLRSLPTLTMPLKRLRVPSTHSTPTTARTRMPPVHSMMPSTHCSRGAHPRGPARRRYVYDDVSRTLRDIMCRPHRDRNRTRYYAGSRRPRFRQHRVCTRRRSRCVCVRCLVACVIVE
jgi:hypothetical protein